MPAACSGGAAHFLRERRPDFIVAGHNAVCRFAAHGVCGLHWTDANAMLRQRDLAARITGLVDPLSGELTLNTGVQSPGPPVVEDQAVGDAAFRDVFSSSSPALATVEDRSPVRFIPPAVFSTTPAGESETP